MAVLNSSKVLVSLWIVICLKELFNSLAWIEEEEEEEKVAVFILLPVFFVITQYVCLYSFCLSLPFGCLSGWERDKKGCSLKSPAIVCFFICLSVYFFSCTVSMGDSRLLVWGKKVAFSINSPASASFFISLFACLYSVFCHSTHQLHRLIGRLSVAGLCGKGLKKLQFLFSCLCLFHCTISWCVCLYSLCLSLPLGCLSVRKKG